MKTLLVTECPVDVINGTPMYGLPIFIKRYSCFGKLTICAYPSDETVSNPQLPNISNVGFVLLKKENSITNMVFNRKFNIKVLKSLIKNSDFVIVHLPSPVGNHAIALAHKIKKPTFTGVIGCAFESMWYYNWKGKLMAIPAYMSMKRTILNSSFAFYVSQKYLQRKYPCNGPSFGASNVEISRLDVSKLEDRINKIINMDLTSRGEIHLATLGAVNVPYKGFQFVIKAIAELNKLNGPKFHYHCIGGGDQTKLRRLSINKGIENYIHFTGLISKEAVKALLDSKIDIYIHPSLTEGIPRSVIEAQSLALPTFGADIPAIRELVPAQNIFARKSSIAIFSLLKSLNHDILIESAKFGFNNASNYTSEILDERRSYFFQEILKIIRQ